ncbi:glycosyl transferase family 1 [Motilibacter rhizosphaerae]|uniref:Glycosyl transferase family 1 n=1 Tax=Motilibacter rhizosphaerae TaxID=598652 RepID=A0A4V2F4F0_9ACTN|nr:glycosyltransferase [Motilibacter rhizosphaerae]RZS87377.1 glycosyl transferase family 1 [Motilibacter rhizosphaerae]
MFAAKSPWSPAIRREHALAQEAVAAGHRVDFVEQPVDVRALRSPRGAYDFARGLRGHARQQVVPGGSVRVWSRSTVLPGHRGEVGRSSNGLLLQQLLRRVTTPESVLVCQAPWDWHAVRSTPARRRVFDCTDDWTALMPHRAAMVRDTYARIGVEADEVIVVNPSLAEDFPRARVTVVRNGVLSALVRDEPASRPGARRMAYVGTLSERFDAPLLARVLELLPDWSLDLYGQCRYAGHGDEPAPELQQLLDTADGRVRWHGVVSREQLGSVLDAADVLVVANRPELSQGQSSMKVFDYAARGRPIVTTVPQMADAADAPPGTRLASTAEEFAAMVVEASEEPLATAKERIAWAASAAWSSRWREWSAMAIRGEYLSDDSGQRGA